MQVGHAVEHAGRGAGDGGSAGGNGHCRRDAGRSARSWPPRARNTSSTDAHQGAQQHDATPIASSAGTSAPPSMVGRGEADGIAQPLQRADVREDRLGTRHPGWRLGVTSSITQRAGWALRLGGGAPPGPAGAELAVAGAVRAVIARRSGAELKQPVRLLGQEAPHAGSVPRPTRRRQASWTGGPAFPHRTASWAGSPPGSPARRPLRLRG